MSKRVTLSELRAMEGQSLSPTEWIDITQSRIDQFAQCTDDDQFIHVDPVRAADTPLGSTVAHGFLSLSLLAGHEPPDWPELIGCRMTLNYGLDRVRFIQPVKVNSRVRFHTTIAGVEEKAPGRVLVKSEVTLEIEGAEKPAMVAQALAMFVLD